MATPAPGVAQTPFIAFETAPVRPLAISPDATKLFVCNIPDNTLEIFDVDPSGALTHSGSVPVGMEPVAVAARTNDEVWVVNFLSDSVSIVDVSSTPRVTRTLLVGDEPSDIVFAGTGGNRAFITAAHRGQNSPYILGDHDQPGIGRADVWVFDATALGTALGGMPIEIVSLFGDKPRGLAVSPDGSTVYAAVFRSGNQTTTVHEGLVCDTSPANVAAETVEGSCTIDGVVVPGGWPPPHKNHEGVEKHETGLIVKKNRDGGTSGEWQDELGRDWSGVVRLDLPDLDVFAISANTNPPAETDSYAHVGTLLYNMVTNPVSGNLYVSNTEANNHVRFEGLGTLASTLKPPGEPASVRGSFAKARISVIDSGGTVTPRHLNKHIDYTAVPQAAGVEEKSLSMPMEMAVTADGATLYVAAFGSAEIGVFDTAALEGDTFVPSASTHIGLSSGGPSGLVLNGDRLYTLTRFNNSVVEIDLTQGAVGAEIASTRLHNPEPSHVVEGRPFLYDARLTGSNGEASCAGCHPFADMDDLAWDLGEPDADVEANTNPIRNGLATDFHPIKGPMATQTLRGMINNGPQHWRGDRQGDAEAAFNAFNVAFPGLVGRDEGELDAADMQKFTDFVLEVTFPPNPLRKLDNTLRPEEAQGEVFYFGTSSDTTGNCNTCHLLNPAFGQFGTDGKSSFQFELQQFKTPHLRNLYQKVGMFGMPRTPKLPSTGDYTHQGDQVRGFGFLHDGSFDTLFRFVDQNTFGSITETQLQQFEQFQLVFPSELAPMVGQQITKAPASDAAVDVRIDDMITAASTSYPSLMLGPGANQCDVIVKGVVAGEQIGGLLTSGGDILPDDGSAAVSESTFRAQATTAGQELTYSCVPFGSGVRMGVDRDLDGHLNRVDNCPDVKNPNQVDANMNSVGDVCEPGATTTTTTSTTTTTTSTTTTTLFPPRVFDNRQMKISGLNRPAGEQDVKIKSDPMIAAGLAIDPPVDGLTIGFHEASTLITSATIAPADPDWKSNSSGTRFKWRARSAPNPSGLRSASIKIAKDRVTVKFAFKDTDASLAVGGVGAADVTMIIGDFTWLGLTGPCDLSSSGASVKCR